MVEDDTPFGETEHRPYAMPERPWRIRQRWSRLLFAHWPVPAAEVQAKLPRGLTVDTFEGWAWLGVVPFMMDRVRFRSVGMRTFQVPTAGAFPELNLRTYVKSSDPSGQQTRKSAVVTAEARVGVYFFSLDAGSLLAVIGARLGFALPYFWAAMRERVDADGTVSYRSRRLLGPGARFEAKYRSLEQPAAKDDLARFLTERYALFTRRWGAVQVGEIHHRPWDLEEAEAEIALNTLPQSFGFRLPDRPPILHYSHEIEMEGWTLRRAR